MKNKLLKKIFYPLAKRFFAGETAEDALRTAERLNAEGFEAILNYLGEKTKNAEDADNAALEYLRLLSEIKKRGLKARISIKPSQLGIELGSYVYWYNLVNIGRAATNLNIPLEIDMEECDFINKILVFTVELKKRFPRLNIRQALQVKARRTEADIEYLLVNKIGVRLCKGAYAIHGAFSKKETKRMYLNYARLSGDVAGADIANATHDESLIQRCSGLKPSAKFQFLLGFKQNLARRLLWRHEVAIYVPYGTEWLPYGIRRWQYIVVNFPGLIKDYYRGRK